MIALGVNAGSDTNGNSRRGFVIVDDKSGFPYGFHADKNTLLETWPEVTNRDFFYLKISAGEFARLKRGGEPGERWQVTGC